VTLRKEEREDISKKKKDEGYEALFGRREREEGRDQECLDNGKGARGEKKGIKISNSESWGVLSYREGPKRILRRKPNFSRTRTPLSSISTADSRRETGKGATLTKKGEEEGKEEGEISLSLAQRIH